MSNKMHFLFVVYVCILQCQLFEFRATYHSHVHQTPDHHHGLRVARSAQPYTVLVTPAPSSNPQVQSSAISETPTTANESENTTPENPTNDEATNTKQEESEVKEIQPVKTEDDEVATSTTQMENPSAMNIAAPKGNNPEIVFTPSTPISDAEPSETQEEPEITPIPNKEYDDIFVVQTAYPADTTQELPKTNQQTMNEAEERPNTEHQSSNTSVPTENADKEEISPANVASNDDSTAQQTIPTNEPKNVQTEPVENAQCTECRAVH